MRTRRASLLASLPPAETHRLTCGTSTRRLQRNDVLFLAGARPDRLFLVRHGVIKLCARDHQGRQVVLDVATSGDLLGTSAAVLGQPHHHDAIGATQCSIVTLEAKDTLATIARTPEAASALFAALAREARGLAQISVERTASSSRARLAARLLHLGDSLGIDYAGAIDVTLPLRQEELGHLAGVSREQTNRELNRLRRNGVLDYSAGRLRILRPDVLERLRCGERAAGSFRSIGEEGRVRPRPRSGI